MSKGSDISGHRMAYANARAAIEGQMVNGMREYVVNRDKNPNDPKEAKAKTITLTDSYLRTRNRLGANLTNYNFGILVNDPSSSPAGPNNGNYALEKRLSLQDVFFVYEMGFFLYTVNTPGGNAEFEFIRQTFPNPNFYGASGLDLNLMQQIWEAGTMSVTVNGDVLTPAWSMSDHSHVPQTQINALNWPGGDNPQNFFNQMEYNSYGFKIVEPNWIINGGNKNLFTVNYPTALNNIGLGGIVHIELYFRGFLAQNASSIMNNQPSM